MTKHGNLQADATHEHRGHAQRMQPQPVGHPPSHGTMAPDTRQPPQDHHEMMVADFRRRFRVCLAVTVPVLLLSPLVQQVFHQTGLRFAGDRYVLLAFSSFIYAYGGYPFLKGALEEAAERLPGMMTLIAVAITAAFVYSAAVVFGLRGGVFFWELATLIDIMLLGHWIEMRSVMGASRALQELAKLMPEYAHLQKEDGSTQDVPANALKNGDRVLVKPGERVPADGKVVGGRSSLNEAMLTGESTPVEKGEGEEVIGGAINGEGALEIEVEKTGADSYISQVIRLVEEAQASKSRSQDLANRAALWLVAVALTAGGATLALWLVAGQPFNFALTRAITVMVIACPHALGLAVPLVVAASTALAAGHGLLIRQRNAFELARRLDAVVFDKTGTLTEGRFGVSGIAVRDGRSEDDVLRLAAAVESRSEHPIARGVVREAMDRNLEIPPVSDFIALTGKGARGTVDGREIMVASPSYVEEKGIQADSEAVRQIFGKGRTVVYVLEGERLLGAIALADVIRQESRQAVQRLHALGIKAMMLTGDNAQVADWVAGELELDEHFAQVLPNQKAGRIKELQRRGLVVAMVGDGVNDAPALGRATLGIAMGAAGSDAAIETADIALMSDDLSKLPWLIHHSRRTLAGIHQNIMFSLTVKAIFVALTFAGYASLWAAIAADMGASLLVIFNGLRLLR